MIKWEVIQRISQRAEKLTTSMGFDQLCELAVKQLFSRVQD
jgi:hypothetical protein